MSLASTIILKAVGVSVLSDTSFCMLAVEFEERITGGVEDVCAR